MNAHAPDSWQPTYRRARSEPRGPISEETRERMRTAARARARTPAHGVAISDGLRKRNAACAPEERRRGVGRAMTDEEHRDFRTLRGTGYGLAEALVAIGRPDLIDYRPTPRPPRRIYRTLTVDEKRALWRVWREATSWQHALELIGRGDLLACH